MEMEFQVLAWERENVVGLNQLVDLIRFIIQHHYQQYCSYIMAASFIGGRSRSTRRESPTMGKQLVNFITCRCECTHFCNFEQEAPQVFSGVRIARSLIFCVIFYNSLFFTIVLSVLRFTDFKQLNVWFFFGQFLHMHVLFFISMNVIQLICDFVEVDCMISQYTVFFYMSDFFVIKQFFLVKDLFQHNG